MKPVKAIDLVWKAQPMISTLKTIMADLAAKGGGAPSTLVQHCDEWLDAARTLLRKKGEQ
jgi:hypothetical protein